MNDLAQQESFDDVLIAPNKLLRVKSRHVDVIDDSVKSLINKMFNVMYENGGIGLSAPQIGVHSRVVVMDINDKSEPLAMINPVILERSGTLAMKEGCLSVPYVSETVSRDALITVEYTDITGERKTLEASGLKSACIQHEIDHLDGVLFIDRLSRLKKDMIMTKLRKRQQS